jgi:hypothetical protein
MGVEIFRFALDKSGGDARPDSSKLGVFPGQERLPVPGAPSPAPRWSCTICRPRTAAAHARSRRLSHDLNTEAPVSQFGVSNGAWGEQLGYRDAAGNITKMPFTPRPVGPNRSKSSSTSRRIGSGHSSSSRRESSSGWPRSASPSRSCGCAAAWRPEKGVRGELEHRILSEFSGVHMIGESDKAHAMLQGVSRRRWLTTHGWPHAIRPG